MNLSDLTKSQQHLALGGAGAVVLGALLVFGIRLSLSSLREAQEQLEVVRGKIETAERSLARRGRTERDLAKVSRELGELLGQLPPERNYFSWATEVIYSVARDSGLEIEAIDEQSSGGASRKGKPASRKKGGKAGSAIELESYSLRIAARGSYRSVRSFLEQIEREQTLARVTGVEISAAADPELHDVQIFIQWPFNLDSIAKAWNAIEAKRKSMESGSPGTARQASDGKTRPGWSKGAGK